MTRTSATVVTALAALVVTAAGAVERGRSAPTAAAHGEIAVATTAGRILLIDESGHRVRMLTRRSSGATFDRQPAWSPDGTRLAFTRTSDDGRSYRVFVMRADGSGVRPVSRGRFAGGPAWSPDGRWIAYSSESGLRLVRADGSRTRTVGGTGKATADCTESYATYPSWTPDGTLSFSFHSETPTDWPEACRQPHARCGWVVTSRLDGGARAAVVHGRDAHWSAAAAAIVYTLPDGGVATVSTDAGRPHLLGRGYLADWSADSRRIVFARLGQTAAGDSIWLMNADGGNRHLLMRGATDPAWRPAG